MLPQVGFQKYFSGDAMTIDFRRFVERHSESGAQALIENLEHYEGVPSLDFHGSESP
jgi:hypothetical protein